MEPNQEQIQNLQNPKKINLKAIIVIVSILLIVVLGGGYYYLSLIKSENINTMTNEKKEITKEEAKEIALREISKLKPDTFLILDDKTIDTPTEYIFQYDTKKHIETGDVKDMVPGNMPIFVNKLDGNYRFVSMDEFIKKYEKSNKENTSIEDYNYYIAFNISSGKDASFKINDLFNPLGKISISSTQPILIDAFITNGLNKLKFSIKKENKNNRDFGKIKIVRTKKDAKKLMFSRDVENAELVNEFSIIGDKNSEELAKEYEFSVDSSVVFPWLSSLDIKDDPLLKKKIVEKNKEIYQNFKNKDREKIMNIFRSRNELLGKLHKGVPNAFESFNDVIKESIDLDINDIDFSKDDSFSLFLFANNKLATLSSRKDKYMPIFMFKDKDFPEVKSYLPLYFMLNTSGEFELIY